MLERRRQVLGNHLTRHGHILNRLASKIDLVHVDLTVIQVPISAKVGDLVFLDHKQSPTVSAHTKK